MSKDSKYIAANGEILEGARANEARLDAQIQRLMRELPPPTYPMLPKDAQVPEAKQPTDVHPATESPCTPNTTDDSGCSDDEFDQHRTLSQQMGEPTTESTTAKDSSLRNEEHVNSPTQAASTKPKRFSADVKGVHQKILKQDTKKTETEKTAKLSVTATGIDAEVSNTNTVGAKQTASATVNVHVQATAIEIKAANTNSKVVDAKASGKVDVTTKGISVKAVSCDQNVLSLEKEGSADAKVELVSGNFGNSTINAVKANVKANVSASSNAATVETGCASATGIEAGAKAEASAEARGAHIQVGEAEIRGVKFGEGASAHAETTGVEEQDGTLRVNGAEITTEATVTDSAGSEVKIKNVIISGKEGAGNKHTQGESATKSGGGGSVKSGGGRQLYPKIPLKPNLDSPNAPEHCKNEIRLLPLNRQKLAKLVFDEPASDSVRKLMPISGYKSTCL